MARYLLENDAWKLLRGEVAKKPLASDAKVLNIACEFDLVPVFLRGSVSESNVYGVEINREIVARVPNISYCDVDHDAFPFPDASFDLVVSIFGIEHFQTANVFKEAKRVLKPGGRFVFLVPNGLYPAFLVNRIFGEGFAKFWYKSVAKSTYSPHKAYYKFNRLGTINRASRDAGFASSDLTFFGPSNILLYFQNHKILQGLATVFEWVLTNPLFFRFKPYIVAVLS